MPGDHPQATVCDLVAGRRLSDLALGDHPDFPIHLRVSDDGRLAVQRPTFARGSRPLRVFDTTTGAVVREIAVDDVADIAIAPDSDLIAVTFAGVRSPAMWRVSTGQPVPLPALPTDPISATFDRTGRRLVLFGGESVIVIDLATTTIATKIDTSNLSVGGEAKIDHSASRVVMLTGERTARVWNADTGTLLMSADGVPEHAFAISGDGARLATASFDGRVRVWDVATGRIVEVFHADGAGGLEWSADGTRLVARSGDDSTVSLWDLHVDRRSPAEIDALAARATRWRVVDGLLVDR